MNDVGFIEEDDVVLVDSKVVTPVGNVWSEASEYDFLNDTKKRLSGVNKDTFEEEVQAWSDGFKMLPKYDTKKYQEEISEMEMHFQSDSNFSFDTLVVLYSTQVSYRNRLTAMKSIVNANYEIYNQAYKSLDKQAFKLFSKAGGSVDDRRADAAHVVAPFLRLSTQAKSMLDQIEEMISNIEFAAFQLSRLLREREALAKINTSFEREGQHTRLHTDYQSRIRPTRKSDDDGFEQL